MLLSSELMRGPESLSILVAVVRELLQHPKLKGKYLLSERFSQDPWRTFLRRSDRLEGHPNVNMIEEATEVLCLQASSALDVVRRGSRLKCLFQENVLEANDTVLPAKREVKAKTL